MRIEFPKSPGDSMYKSLSYKLYRLHNRHHDGQIVLVWKSGADFSFTFHDEPVQFLLGRDWVCIGELEWRVEGDHFVHELMPLQHRIGAGIEGAGGKNETASRVPPTFVGAVIAGRTVERPKLNGELRSGFLYK